MNSQPLSSMPFLPWLSLQEALVFCMENTSLDQEFSCYFVLRGSSESVARIKVIKKFTYPLFCNLPTFIDDGSHTYQLCNINRNSK